MSLENQAAIIVAMPHLPTAPLNPSMPAASLTSSFFSSFSSAYFCPLPSLGLLQVSGADAVTFLQSQLTNEVIKQPQEQVALNGYCQPKGRLLASFLAWKNADAVYLSLAADLAAPISKRLSLFVLRAKAKVTDVSAQFVHFGVLLPAPSSAELANEPAAGLATETPATRQTSPLALPTQVYGLVHTPHYTAIRLPNQQKMQRYLLVSAAEHASATQQHLQTFATLSDENTWRLAEIHAGIPHIVAATSEKFVPQMLNYDLLGGVSFKKGCYPGQEVVARTQYLGKLKRRVFLASTGSQAALMAPGTDVFAAEKTEAVGTVVNAAHNGQGGVDVLLEITLEAAQSAQQSTADNTRGNQDVKRDTALADRALHSGGAALTLLPLPYDLSAEPASGEK